MNESSTDDSCQPAWAMKPSTPRAIRKAEPMVISGASAVNQQHDQNDEDDRVERRSVRALFDRREVVAADSGLAGDLGDEAGGQDSGLGEVLTNGVDRRHS